MSLYLGTGRYTPSGCSQQQYLGSHKGGGQRRSPKGEAKGEAKGRGQRWSPKWEGKGGGQRRGQRKRSKGSQNGRSKEGPKEGASLVTL